MPKRISLLSSEFLFSIKSARIGIVYLIFLTASDWIALDSIEMLRQRSWGCDAPRHRTIPHPVTPETPPLRRDADGPADACRRPAHLRRLWGLWGLQRWVRLPLQLSPAAGCAKEGAFPFG